MPDIRHTLTIAKEEGWAVGAFNAANISTLKAIFRAAQKLEAPVIIESSVGETEFFGHRAFREVIDSYRDLYDVQAFINLDHAVALESINEAIRVGYELVHFDGGDLPYEDNVKLAKKVVKKAHQKELLVEGEIDHITGSSKLHKSKAAQVQAEGNYTEAARAAEFVKATNVDTLAVFIGNVHGIYADSPELDLERLQEISKTVDSFLSLHGGSGIRDADIKKAIKNGISKINVNSELRLAFFNTLKDTLKTTDELAAYKFMTPVIDEVQKVVEKKIKVFGSAGKAKSKWLRRSI